VHTGFCYGNLREGDNLEDPGVEGRIILQWAFRKWGGGMEHIDRWLTVVNAVINLQVP
jgi:hypothetical protein